MNTIQIVLLFLIILAAQAFYMYLSSKNQFRRKWYLYVLAIPLVTAFPVIMHSHNTYAFDLYQYAIVVCIIVAAFADICYAAKHNEDYMTDDHSCGFLYAYLMITAAIAWYGSTSFALKVITMILLTGSITVCSFVRKHSLKELVRASVLALFSTACSWAFLTFAL